MVTSRCRCSAKWRRIANGFPADWIRSDSPNGGGLRSGSLLCGRPIDGAGLSRSDRSYSLERSETVPFGRNGAIAQGPNAKRSSRSATSAPPSRYPRPGPRRARPEPAARDLPPPTTQAAHLSARSRLWITVCSSIIESRQRSRVRWDCKNGARTEVIS